MAKADHIWEEVKERYARMKTYRHVESGLFFGGGFDDERIAPGPAWEQRFYLTGRLSFKRPDYFHYAKWSNVPAVPGHHAGDISAYAVGSEKSFVVHRPKDDEFLKWFTKIFPSKDGSSKEIDRNIFKCIPAISIPFTFAIIPSLLNNKITVPPHAFASPLKSLLLPDQIIDGHDCYHIILYDKKMNPRHLWIDKQMYVIRQTRFADELCDKMNFVNFTMGAVTSLMKVPKVKMDFSDASKIIYDRIEINQEIPDSVFDPANVSAGQR